MSTPCLQAWVLVTDTPFGTSHGMYYAYAYLPTKQVYYVIRHAIIPPTTYFPVCAECDDPSKFHRPGHPKLVCYNADASLFQDFKLDIATVHKTFKKLYDIENGNLAQYVQTLPSFVRVMAVFCVGMVLMSMLYSSDVKLLHIPRIKHKSVFWQMSFVLIKDLAIQLSYEDKVMWLAVCVLSCIIGGSFAYFFLNVQIHRLISASNFWVYVFIGLIIIYFNYGSKIQSERTYRPINARHLTTEFLVLMLLNIFFNIVLTHKAASMFLNTFYPLLVCCQLVGFV